MSRHAWIALLAIAAAACGGGNGPTSPTASLILKGTVSDRVTGNAIAGARVSLDDGGSSTRYDTTGNDGTYAFQGLGHVTVSVQATALSYDSLSKTVTLQSDQTLPFQLVPVARLQGKWAGAAQLPDVGGAVPAVVEWDIFLSLTQTDDFVSGYWQMDRPGEIKAFGSLGGHVTSASFDGVFDYNTMTPRCAGIQNIAGPITDDSITLTTYEDVEACPEWPQHVTVTATRYVAGTTSGQ